MSTIKTIEMPHFQTLLQEGADFEIIDVRTPAEFRDLHAPQARNIPLDELDGAAYLRSRGSNPEHAASQTVYVTCQSGTRGNVAAQKLMDAGFTDVRNLEGGMNAWRDAGADVVRGKKTISLERQVRIVAGLLVAIGTLLGVTLNPWFLVVPAFVGCGLTFAGITDFCGMGLLLARAPWNR